MLTKDNKNLFQNKKINEKVELHSQCIIQMNNFHDELLLERNNYRELKCKYDKLEADYNELKVWKENHICNSNVNIEEIKTNIKNEVKKEYDEIILKLNSDINILNMNKIDKIEIPIEDNILFKSLKEKNKQLEEDNKEIHEKFNDIKNYNNINNFNIKINEALKIQKEENDIFIENIKQEYQKTINELKTQINNKSNKNKKDKENNNFIDSIKLYKNIDSKSKEYVSSYTYRQISDYNILRNLIIEEHKEENYDNIINYMFKYISNRKSKWYFMKKIKRCLYLYDTYNNNLKVFNFSISFISGLSDGDWSIWLNTLDEIINKDILNDKNVANDLENKVQNRNIPKCVNEKCDNYYENYEYYCEFCNSNTKKCDNCGEEFITDKLYIIECGDC